MYLIKVSNRTRLTVIHFILYHNTHVHVDLLLAIDWYIFLHKVPFRIITFVPFSKLTQAIICTFFSKIVYNEQYIVFQFQEIRAELGMHIHASNNS